MRLMIGLLATMAVCAWGHCAAQAPAGAVPEDAGKRPVTETWFGVDAVGDRIAAMLGGLSESTVSLIDLGSRQVTSYGIGSKARLIRVALSRDGHTIYVMGTTRKQMRSGAWYDRPFLAAVDVASGHYRVLNTHAAAYDYDIVPSPDGKYLFYFRSSRDAPPLPGEARGKTTYTHGFSAFIFDRLLARYDLAADREDLIGPIAVPHGNSVLDLQVTGRNIYFYADGISQAMTYDFDPSWSFTEAMTQALARQDAYSHAYLQPHPSDIEAIDPADIKAMSLFLYRLPVGMTDLAAGEKVATVHPEDLGISPQARFVDSGAKRPRVAAYQAYLQAQATSRRTIRFDLSDDEASIMFANGDVSCWGQRTQDQALSCADYDHRDIGPGKSFVLGHPRLSPDGHKLVFLSSGTALSDGNDFTWQVCTLTWPSGLEACHWLGADRFHSRDATAEGTAP